MFSRELSKLIVLLAVIFFSAPYVFAANSGNTEGQAWTEKGGYVNFDDAGGLYETTWTN